MFPVLWCARIAVVHCGGFQGCERRIRTVQRRWEDS